MSKAFSDDVRIRVLAAVEAGARHRRDAEGFGVSAASVRRWRTLPRHCPIEREAIRSMLSPHAQRGGRRTSVFPLDRVCAMRNDY